MLVSITLISPTPFVIFAWSMAAIRFGPAIAVIVTRIAKMIRELFEIKTKKQMLRQTSEDDKE